MRKYLIRYFTMAFLVCGGSLASGQGITSVRADSTGKIPRSGFEAFGGRANTVRDMDWQRKFLSGFRAVPSFPSMAPAVSNFATNLNVSGGPVGTEEMFVYRHPVSGDDCLIAPSVTTNGIPVFINVFDKSFTTGPGSRYLQVIFTTQASLGAGVGVDGLMIQCLVTQNSVTLPCSNTEYLPFLLSRNSSGAATTGVVTYSGYVSVDPNTPTAVTIDVSVWRVGTWAAACGNSLILRY